MKNSKKWSFAAFSDTLKRNPLRLCVRSRRRNNGANPFAAFYEQISGDTFDDLQRGTNEKHRHNVDACEAGKHKRNGDAYAPDIAAVKQHGDLGLAAGTQREIARMGKGMERHAASADDKEGSCKRFYFSCGVV